MAERSHYLVLGVPRDESAAGIRSAYRALARRYHPDIGGDASTQAFQDISEAYRILSDPGLRREYDERTAPAEAHDRGRARAGVEPLRPFAWDLGSLFDVRASARPSLEDLYERSLRSFTTNGVPRGERPRSLDFDLVLTGSEAAYGGTVRVPVAVFARCQACAGSGHDWLLPCVACGERGVVEVERRVPVAIPPMTRPGTIIEAPLDALGIQSLLLRLHVSVG